MIIPIGRDLTTKQLTSFLNKILGFAFAIRWPIKIMSCFYKPKTNAIPGKRLFVQLIISNPVKWRIREVDGVQQKKCKHLWLRNPKISKTAITNSWKKNYWNKEKYWSQKKERESQSNASTNHKEVYYKKCKNNKNSTTHLVCR